MSENELRRVEVLGRVQRGEMNLTEAAAVLELGYRQTKRLWSRFRRAGPSGLVHGNAGRRSNRAKPAALRRQIVGLIQSHYGGEQGPPFGPTLAAEHLHSEHGLTVHPETLRRWMRAEGLWPRQRQRAPHRRRRERKAHFGELLQLDGSHHHWLEQRGPQGCLMNLVDDASGVSLGCFHPQETTWAAADVLERWVRRYGIPQALYTDWKNVYLRQPTAREQLQGIVPRTQFGGMCEKLGIRIVPASSPQAKGRVERHHGTHQDRLVKKLRRAGVADYQAANRFLDAGYFQQHNRRFAQAPAAEADFHRVLPRGLDLRWVFCLEEPRTVGRDTVVRYHNRWLQLELKRRSPVAAGGQVLVQQARDGELRLLAQGQRLSFREIAPPAPRGKVPAATAPLAHRRPRRGHTPAPDHPWRKPVLPMRPPAAEATMAAGD